MLDTLRFIQGSVAKKDFVAALTHFRIKDGHIRGYNGLLALGSPIDLDLDITPKALPFVTAIATCTDTIQLHMTPSGKLAVRSGKFKALIDCTPEAFPEVCPEGQEVPLSGGLMKVLKTLLPFIAEDASRPWARGILLRGQSAFATNNVVLVEHWLPTPFPVEVNIPKMAVVELLRVGEEPTHLRMSEDSVTFHFPNGRWLRTQTYSARWPDLARVLDQPSNQTAPPEGLWEAIEALAPFVDDRGRLFFSPSGISTCQTDAEGASVELAGLPETGCYHWKQLALLQGIASKLDLTTYPKPCGFSGGMLRGAIVGIRLA